MRRHSGRRDRFAFGLAASSIWLLNIDPLQSGILVAGCGLLLHLTTIWQQRQHVEPARIWPFVVGGLFGVPIGVHFLAYTDAAALKIVLAGFLIVFLDLCAPRAQTRDRDRWAAVPPMSRSASSAGFLAELGGYSGVLPTIWTQLRGWPKEIARAVYQPYVIVMQAVTLAFSRNWIGWKLYGKLDDRRFRQAPPYF